MSEERACTCHPDEAPKPCPQRYAYSECVLAAEIERLRRELNLLKAIHENAEAEVRQLLDENGSLIAVCREFIDRWPTEEGIDNTIQRARAILLDHDLRSPPEHAVNRALEEK